MDIQILRELQPYSISELQSIFASNANELDDILKSLSLMNIVKRVANNVAEVALEELLEVDNIDSLNVQLEGNVYIFKFVGMLTVGETCLIVYPKYVKEYKTDNKYRMLRQLIAVIRKYQSKEQKQGTDEQLDLDNFNLLSITLELIADYLEHGLYRNDRQVIEANGEGEILWDKTINEQTALFSNGTPVYLNTLTINQKNNEQDYFSRLHAAIITEACNRVKDILTIIDVESIDISFEGKEDFGNIEYIIYRLHQEISTQFVTHKQNVLKLIKRYILQENRRRVSQNISFVGTTNFNLVWEDVCSLVMDNCMNKSIKELGLTHRSDKKQSTLLSEIVDKPKWKHNQSGAIHESNKTLIPDIVTIKGDGLSIYDAKYYKIKFDDKEVKNQPGVGDVTKQYLYELAYKNFAEENNLRIDNNAFLLPTDDDKEIRIGTASMEIFHGIGNINFNDVGVFLMPCAEMYRKYLEK